MFTVGNHQIKQGGRPFIIAEVAQAHDGSLGFAHSYIDLAAKCGADAVKFQTHIAQAESTTDEQFRINFSKEDATRYDYWKRMEFTPEQWAGLYEHCQEKNITFLSSAFSVAAVELLKKIGMDAWKVGSGEFRSSELMNAMATTGKPILLSTGMSRYDEIAQGVAWFKERGVPHGLFQCTSMYPTPFDKVGLNVIEELHDKHACPVGLSDHTGSPFPAILAIARGAAMIEVHIVFDKGMFGPDVLSSLTPSDFTQICQTRDAIVAIDSNPINKDNMAEEMCVMRGLFTKSIALSQDLPKGAILTSDLLVPKKPGTGIPYVNKNKYIGKKLKLAVGADRLLRLEDIE